MTEIMPVPRNLNFTVLPAGSLGAAFFCPGEFTINLHPCRTAAEKALPFRGKIRYNIRNVMFLPRKLGRWKGSLHEPDKAISKCIWTGNGAGI